MVQWGGKCRKVCGKGLWTFELQKGLVAGESENVGKRYRVNGLFILEVNAKDTRDAQEIAERILADRGIEGYVIEVEDVRGWMLS